MGPHTHKIKRAKRARYELYVGKKFPEMLWPGFYTDQELGTDKAIERNF